MGTFTEIVDKKVNWLAALLLIIYFAAAFGSMCYEGMTPDELPHLTAGFTYG